MAAAQEHAGISVTPTEPTKFEFSVAADGTIWYGTEDAVEPFAPGCGKTGPERARAMLALRDGARALLALERDPAADDDEVEEAIAELSAEYDSFFERFGRINSKKNLAVFPSKGFTDHSLALNLLSLEKVNSDGEVTGKADILRKRLVTPEAPTPEHVGNPSDALAVTIDARGEVDIDFLADLMETDVQTALERLGDLVVTDPDDASHVMTADEYLSGDVGGKLEHVRELLEAERGRAEPYNGSDYLEAFQSIAAVHRAPRTPDVRRPLGQGVGNRERHARRARPQGGTGRRRVPVPHPAEAVLG